MAQFKTRRSCRVALSVPIRVFGVDYRGVDFTEEASTIIVNVHGAKIRMSHQLLPDAEIRVISHPTGEDAVFRVVSKLQSPELEYTYWGVENLEPARNFWGADIPELQMGDQVRTQVLLECPNCSARESVEADSTLLVGLEALGGVHRICDACNAAGLWKLPMSQAA
ncbi:MAG: hypothetical protein ACLQVL_06035 [Terriglobia bacterium]